LLAAALIAVPIAFIAFGFLAAVTAMQKWVGPTLRTDFGWHEPKPWYAVLAPLPGWEPRQGSPSG